MMDRNGERLRRRAGVLSALASETRLLILEHLQEGEMTVSEITELAGLDISTVSRHLAILKRAGIVSSRAQGSRRLYSIRTSCVMGFLDCVEDVLDEDSEICAGDIRRKMEEMA